ncbi:MAG TPA: hypothetical protein ENH85_06180 [Candidatus Scalindua sp.]|nr:hypothetical protein [Candidatus Scalindua sp.]
MMNDKADLQMVWHAYHAGSLCQLVNLGDRKAEIERIKPQHELPIRRRLIKPVVGQLPIIFVKACQAAWEVREATQEAGEAWEAQEAAREATQEVIQERKAVYRKYKVEIEQLHAQECPDCPWDGETIFPVGTDASLED